MRVEETFSRFRHSFPLSRPDRQLKVVLGPVGPGLYLDENERIAVDRYYINFTAPCPPVARDHAPTSGRKPESGLFLARATRFRPGAGPAFRRDRDAIAAIIGTAIAGENGTRGGVMTETRGK